MGKKIYTAGFDIFHPDAAAHMEAIRQLCVRYGFEPEPLGLAKPGQKKEPLTAERIFEKDISMLDDCEVVAANLNDFRGQEMDCGTAFELGYAYAKGKRLYGYMEDARPLTEKLGGMIDKRGYRVENFGLPINLMLGCSVTIIEGTLEDCLKAIVEQEGE